MKRSVTVYSSNSNHIYFQPNTLLFQMKYFCSNKPNEKEILCNIQKANSNQIFFSRKYLIISSDILSLFVALIIGSKSREEKRNLVENLIFEENFLFEMNFDSFR